MKTEHNSFCVVLLCIVTHCVTRVIANDNDKRNRWDAERSVLRSLYSNHTWDHHRTNNSIGTYWMCVFSKLLHWNQSFGAAQILSSHTHPLSRFFRSHCMASFVLHFSWITRSRMKAMPNGGWATIIYLFFLSFWYKMIRLGRLLQIFKLVKHTHTH